MTEPEEFDREEYDDEPPRSIFSALWFRAVLVVLVLGVIAVIAAPSLLDVVVPRGDRRAAPPSTAASTDAQPAASQPTAPETPAVAQAPGAAAPVMAVTQPPAGDATQAARDAAAPGREAAPPPAPAAAAAPGPKSAPAPARVAAKTPDTARDDATASGPFWVQVAAFKDRESARRLVARLREQNYRVEESVHSTGAAPAASPPAPAAAPTDRYEVFVAGVAVDEIRGKLAGTKATPEAVAGGVVMRPALPLADALALSKDLAGEGRRVQVRRTGAVERERVASATTPVETYYRVRVGGFADRAAAQAAARELEGKGYRPFIARGDQ